MRDVPNLDFYYSFCQHMTPERTRSGNLGNEFLTKVGERQGFKLTNKFYIKIDAESADFIDRLTSETGVSANAIMSGLLGANMSDLSEYFDWLRSLQKPSRRHELGRNLLVSYGPGTLTDGIKEIDPTYRLNSEAFRDATLISLSGDES